VFGFTIDSVMSLRKKILLFTLSICFIAIILLYLLLRVFILDNFLVLEKVNVEENIGRVTASLNTKLGTLDAFTNDYAGWDDTYSFIQNGNNQYIESNLVNETFINTRINLMVFVNKEGELVYSKMVDLDTNKERDLPDDLLSRLHTGDPLLSHTSVDSKKSGILLLKDGPLMVSSYPIITSEKKGPIRGTLFFGRFLSGAELQDLQRASKVKFELFPVTALPESIKPFYSQILASGSNGFVHAGDKQFVDGYTVVNDIYNTPALLFKVVLEREVYLQGERAVLLMGLSFLIICLVSTVAVLLFLDNSILKPMKKLVSDVHEVTSNKNPAAKVSVSGNDEIAALSNEINVMIETVVTSGKELAQVNEVLKKEKLNEQHVIDERTGELQTEHSRLLASIRSLNEAFVMLDTSCEVVLDNPAFLNLLDLEKVPISFELLEELFHGTFNFKQVYEDCILKRQTRYIQDISIRNKFFTFYIAPVLLSETSDKVIGAVLLIHDTTEEKMLNRYRDEFFAIASHELRTPLTAIRGNAEFLKSIYVPKVEGKDFSDIVNDIHTSSLRLIGIVNEFLTTSRLEQGKMNFYIEHFNIIPLIEDVIRQLTPNFTQKGLIVRLKDEKDEVYVVADKKGVQEVLINLIGNAINYTDSGSVVIDVGRDAHLVTIKVIDTGRGISPQSKSMLFKKFEEGNTNIYTRDVHNSTGLGLYISKLMIESMHGRIYLESTEPGKGSTFAFTLPKGTA
jgi:signal transduction histidine kinase/sensor domain CHASE-containing protein